MTDRVNAGAIVDGQPAPAGAPVWATAPAGATLDVRPMLARREEPFQAIMAASAQVAPGQVFQLRSSFEPFPLYHVLGKQGFQHWARQLAPGDWEVLFYKSPAAVNQEASPASGAGTARASDVAWPEPARSVTIDVSDLVPPEPMIRILEALEQLAPGEALQVHHVRRPVYLYARLDELGYRHETHELGPNQVELRILKPAAGGAVAE